MRLFSLDRRLGAVAERVPEGARIWDVGSDHAKLPVWLVATGKCPSATASDIGELPLESAKRNVERYGLSDRIALRLCDGLPSDARNAADVIVIAGMGGSTIAEILAAAPWTQDAGVRLILQPMSSPEDLRAALCAKNYRITDETEVRDGRRRYLIIEAEGGGSPEPFDRADLFAGKVIRDREYLERAARRLRNELAGAEGNRDEIESAIAKIEKIVESL